MIKSFYSSLEETTLENKEIQLFSLNDAFNSYSMPIEPELACNTKSNDNKIKHANNGSLFTYLLATVMENSKENKMSSELPFSRLKMGDRKQGNP